MGQHQSQSLTYLSLGQVKHHRITSCLCTCPAYPNMQALQHHTLHEQAHWTKNAIKRLHNMCSANLLEVALDILQCEVLHLLSVPGELPLQHARVETHPH